MDEQTIISQLLARDERAIGALLRRCGPLVRYVISPILPDEQDRDECVSTVALRVWERIETFDASRGSFRTWLTAIARNAALNMARGARPAEPLGDGAPDAAETPEEAVLRQERQNALLRALERLSPRDRALVYRKYYYRQPTAQIAAELGLTERAVEGRLYRLKKRLRGELGGDGDAT